MQFCGYKVKDIEQIISKQQKFAEEVVRKLKFDYKLYDARPLPQQLSVAPIEVCDAIFALSFIFRGHYRQVYYVLRDELVDANEFELFCFSLPVARGKRYAFNYLFRISFIFEITMYLFKEGYDYFDIVCRCLAAYPDHLYFEAAGGWLRLKLIAISILSSCKVLEANISLEHPLLGSFIQTDHDLLPRNYTLYLKRLLRKRVKQAEMISRGLMPSVENEFFNPKCMQSLKVLYKYFIPPFQPKTKWNLEDVLKIAENFPLTNKTPFKIEEYEYDAQFPIYDLSVEKLEMYAYFRSYLSPEFLKEFPLENEPPVEKSHFDIPECYHDSLHEDSEEESSKSDSFKCLLSQNCDKSMCHIKEPSRKSVIPPVKISTENVHCTRNKDKCIQSSNENIPKVPPLISLSESSKNLDKIVDDVMLTQTENVLKCQSIARNLQDENFHGARSKVECFQSSNTDICDIPAEKLHKDIENLLKESEKLLNDQVENKEISQMLYQDIKHLPTESKFAVIKYIMDISRVSQARKEKMIEMLPSVDEFKYIDQSFLSDIMMTVPFSRYGNSGELIDSLKNFTCVSIDTKYLLFKIILHCSEVKEEERHELFRILMNIPDNSASQKTRMLLVINKMIECSEDIKDQLMDCVLDFTDEECQKFLHCEKGMAIIENFRNVFPNEDNLRKEFKKCMTFYKDEAQKKLNEVKEKVYSELALEGLPITENEEENEIYKIFSEIQNEFLKIDRDHDELLSLACSAEKHNSRDIKEPKKESSSSTGHNSQKQARAKHHSKSTKKSKRRSKK